MATSPLTFHVIQDRFAGCRPTNTRLMQINPRPICGVHTSLIFYCDPSCVAASERARRFTDFQSQKKKITRWPKIICGSCVREREREGESLVRTRHLRDFDARFRLIMQETISRSTDFDDSTIESFHVFIIRVKIYKRCFLNIYN